MQAIRLPNYDSRAVFVGKTGSGKTTLAEKVCAYYNEVVVLDSKGDLNWKSYKVFENLSDLKKQESGKFIWRPNPFEQNQETYDEFFKWIYDRKNCVCYIDEVLAICGSAQSIPFWYRAILTRGRSRGIGCFNGTQAPVHIPHWILSQSENYFVFRLRLETDREKIEKITGIDRDKLKQLENYEFYYADDKDYFPRKLKIKL